MTITCRLYRGGILELAELDPTEVSEHLGQEDVLLWLDVDDPDERSMAMLGEEFGFHELALEDCLHPHQRPKIEQYESYFFLVAYGASIDEDGSHREHEMAAFVGPNYLVTIRKPPPYDLDPVVARWDAHRDLVTEGGGFLLYILLDHIVDGYFAVLDVMQDRAEELEDRVFAVDPADEQPTTEIFKERKDLLRFRRAVSPLRDVLDVMQRRTIGIVTPKLEPYYRDVYDHVLRVTDFVDNLRDLLASTLDAHLAVVSNRLNDVMKKLSSWAAIVLVPTLIAGIYGMNFQHMPELGWLFGYPFALALMTVSAFVLYRVFKRRDWL